MDCRLAQVTLDTRQLKLFERCLFEVNHHGEEIAKIWNEYEGTQATLPILQTACNILEICRETEEMTEVEVVLQDAGEIINTIEREAKKLELFLESFILSKKVAIRKGVRAILKTAVEARDRLSSRVLAKAFPKRKSHSIGAGMKSSKTKEPVRDENKIPSASSTQGGRPKEKQPDAKEQVMDADDDWDGKLNDNNLMFSGSIPIQSFTMDRSKTERRCRKTKKLCARSNTPPHRGSIPFQGRTRSQIPGSKSRKRKYYEYASDLDSSDSSVEHERDDIPHFEKRRAVPEDYYVVVASTPGVEAGKQIQDLLDEAQERMNDFRATKQSSVDIQGPGIHVETLDFDSSGADEDETGFDTKGWQDINIGYATTTTEAGEGTQHSTLLDYSGLPPLACNLIRSKDIETNGRHRLESIKSNVAGPSKCWMSVNKPAKHGSEMWYRSGPTNKGPCGLCQHRAKSSESDMVCFYFTTTFMISAYRVSDSTL